MGKLIEKNDIKQLGIRIARIHNKPSLMDMRGGTRMDGQYLYNKGTMQGMPYNQEIKQALKRTDTIVERIASAVPTPFVMLWNRCYDEYKDILGPAYGNPAWDLGIVVNMLNDEIKAEEFLRQYLNERGILVTIIELYAGILYAKLNDAIIKRNKTEWQQLAKNECSNIIIGKGMKFKEVSAEGLARLGLPGLNRIN